MVVHRVLGTVIGTMIGASIASIPCIIYITKNTTGQSGPNESIVVALIGGPIIVCGAIGFYMS